MSLIVKGMKLPGSCDNCDLIQFDDEGLEAHCPLAPYYRWCGTPPDYRPEGCPLVEIPTPHGRLIDADKLLEAMSRAVERDRHWVNFFGIVEEVPTIIEAENSSAIDDDVKKYCDYLKSETYDFCNRIENGEVSEE